MAKKFKTNINSFTIAHYILLFLVVGLCICIIAWIMIHRVNSAPENNVTLNTTHMTSSDPCVQRTINTVNQMWAYDPKQVPQKYWEIAMNYMNQPITTRTYGLCQDVGYICHPGQILRDCDPCAVPSARTYAQSIHISDMIEKNCNTEN
ncbi:MAG: hypothetical protein J6K82_00855 [Alphaproteobacteria bacterium]|nr:hypothetical protein [Alphaproteobacteria bacterium]